MEIVIDHDLVWRHRPGPVCAEHRAHRGRTNVPRFAAQA
jgi:hypothetical protein